MSYRKSFNNSSLTIRLPEKVLTQFQALCDGVYKTPSELTRHLIINYVNSHKDFLSAVDKLDPTKPTNSPLNNLNSPRQPDPYAGIENEW